MEENDAVPQPACIVQISRIYFQTTQPMYPTELIKLTISNAEYPAGKAMLMCAYTEMSAQVCHLLISLSLWCMLYCYQSVDVLNNLEGYSERSRVSEKGKRRLKQPGVIDNVKEKLLDFLRNIDSTFPCTQ